MFSLHCEEFANSKISGFVSERQEKLSFCRTRMRVNGQIGIKTLPVVTALSDNILKVRMKL
jgi:hypothetical protein